MSDLIPIVGVFFQSADEPHLYAYKNHIPGLKVGDLCVVELPHQIFKVVTIASLRPSPSQREKATKWLVDRVQLNKYNALSQLVPPPEKDE